jgi:hypothetical protein
MMRAVGALASLGTQAFDWRARAVHAGLTGRHPCAGHDHRLNAHEECVAVADAGIEAMTMTGGGVDGDHRPGGIAARGRAIEKVIEGASRGEEIREEICRARGANEL